MKLRLRSSPLVWKRFHRWRKVSRHLPLVAAQRVEDLPRKLDEVRLRRVELGEFGLPPSPSLPHRLDVVVVRRVARVEDACLVREDAEVRAEGDAGSFLRRSSTKLPVRRGESVAQIASREGGKFTVAVRLAMCSASVAVARGRAPPSRGGRGPRRAARRPSTTSATPTAAASRSRGGRRRATRTSPGARRAARTPGALRETLRLVQIEAHRVPLIASACSPCAAFVSTTAAAVARRARSPPRSPSLGPSNGGRDATAASSVARCPRRPRASPRREPRAGSREVPTPLVRLREPERTARPSVRRHGSTPAFAGSAAQS